MKIALYIADGLTQVVLTPETNHEENVVKLLSDKGVEWIKHGSFYETNGGWIRHSDADRSLMLVLRAEPVKETTVATGGMQGHGDPRFDYYTGTELP